MGKLGFFHMKVRPGNFQSEIRIIKKGIRYYSNNFDTSKFEWIEKMKKIVEGYKKFYPFDVIDGYAILYKSVHKTKEGKFVSDKDRNFEYVVGETKQHECDPSTEQSCTVGLHVGHKMWAMRFGHTWPDMALLEVKVPIAKIVVAKDCDGKVRTSE